MSILANIDPEFVADTKPEARNLREVNDVLRELMRQCDEYQVEIIELKRNQALLVQSLTALLALQNNQADKPRCTS